MFGLGFSEIVVIGILALILLGPEQLPDLARTIGRFVNDLKRTTDGLKEEFEQTSLHPSNLLEEIKRENKYPNTSALGEGHHHQNTEPYIPVEHVNYIPDEVKVEPTVTAAPEADLEKKKVTTDDGSNKE